MTRNSQEYIDRIINKEKQFSLNLKDQKLAGEMDLKGFTNLISIQAGGNEFTNLDWLSTLPESSRKKIKWINLWGNEIKNVDFAGLVRLLNDLSCLESINLENNPLNGSNLDRLNDQEFSQLVELVETKKLKINSWKGTFLVDLLRHVKRLKEENTQLKQQLQTQIEIPPK